MLHDMGRYQASRPAASVKPQLDRHAVIGRLDMAGSSRLSVA